MPEILNGLGLTTEDTIALANGLKPGTRNPTSAAVKTGITAATTALGGYSLEAPAKSIYFIEDAMRRRIPRVVNPIGSDTAHWKVITAINSGKVKAGVAEGALATALTMSTAPKSMAMRTLNQYNTFTDEAKVFGRRFMDIPNLGMLATLQSEMIQEDRYILGGVDVTIGGPTTVTAVDSGATGTFAATGYYFVVSALTIHGWQNAAKGRIAGVDAADESIGTTANSGALTPTSLHGVTLSWTDVPGAFAYNIYCGTASFAAAVYIGTAYKNLVTLTSPTSYNGATTGTGVTNLADQTADQYGYQGMIQQLTALTGTVGSTGSYGTKTAYYLDNAGVAPTSDGAGGCVEIETALQSIWNSWRAYPTMMLVNSQEAKSLKKLTIGSSSSNAVRINISQDDKNKFTAGSAVDTYYSPYAEQLINIVTSVHCPPGKIMLLGERVPYPNAEAPNNFEVELQQEYYGEFFARTTRTTPVGVTCIGALKIYAPGLNGIIANLAAA